tara:strand:+ start:3113 stop:4324 length:1212 start_codon:yes stop_codon:yes gene_type:complete
VSEIKTKSSPFFSIVIPTRDRSDLVSGLIWSILEQNHEDFEIVVCDNSGSNLTQEVLSQFQDDRIINIRTGSLGMSENYNVGINAVSGKYLMCISDKGILKQGALKYLRELISAENHQCITWALDDFVYPGTFFKNPAIKDSKSIQSSEILKFMLGSDYRSYEPAPMHCTSCTSMELVSAIQKKHENLCQAQNPDYTMAAQILLATQSVFNLKNSLVMLRNVSTKNGYGMGHSLAKKTQESQIFLAEHADWIKDTNRFTDVPVQDCPFIIDLMLKDTYKVLEDNAVNPDMFLSREERLTAYYFFAYDEIIWRKSLGVNMSPESKIWSAAFQQESHQLQRVVNQRIKSLRLASLKAHCKYLVKNNLFASFVLRLYRSVRYVKSGIIYKDLEDCHRKNFVEDYIK